MSTITGKTNLVGLLGQPVNHSLSPIMHNAAYEEMGLDWCYVAIPCDPKNLEKVTTALRLIDCKGLIITIPHKQEILKACNKLTLAANLITDWSFGTKQHLGNHPLPGYWMLDSSIQLITQSKKRVQAQDLIACNQNKEALTVASNIDKKVTIISGREDKMTPVKKAKELHDVIDNSELIIIENVGHKMMIENPVKVTRIMNNLFL